MRAVTGVILGMTFGLIQLLLLMYAVGSLRTGRLKIWPFAVQFFCPFLGLCLCALLRTSQLLPCAVAMSTILVAGAAIQFIRHLLRESQRKKD